jgi:hypothetical protein
MPTNTSNISNADKRTYSRVSTNFRAIYRILSSPDEPQIAPRNLAIGNNNLRSRFETGSNLPEVVAAVLLNLDSKLDGILMQMRQDTLTQHFSEDLLVTEISASGVLARGNIQIGECIEMVMFVSEFPACVASAKAKVLRPKGGPGTFAVQFTHIRESDRESIVRYVFQSERERIRAEKYK